MQSLSNGKINPLKVCHTGLTLANALRQIFQILLWEPGLKRSHAASWGCALTSPGWLKIGCALCRLMVLKTTPQDTYATVLVVSVFCTLLAVFSNLHRMMWPSLMQKRSFQPCLFKVDFYSSDCLSGLLGFRIATWQIMFRIRLVTMPVGHLCE